MLHSSSSSRQQEHREEQRQAAVSSRAAVVVVVGRGRGPAAGDAAVCWSGRAMGVGMVALGMGRASGGGVRW